MFKKIKVIITFSCVWFFSLEACLQTVAISNQDFCEGTSLVFITRGVDGVEEIAGYISFKEGKTQFSQEEFLLYDSKLLSMPQESAKIITHIQQDELELEDDALIYLHFQVDEKLDIVKILVIKNNLLADNPFDVLEIPASSMYQENVYEDDEDDDDDYYEDDELSHLNLTNVQGLDQGPSSYYDLVVVGAYFMWAMQVAQAEEKYNQVLEWFKSKYAE